METQFYTFSAKNIDGKTVSKQDFKGKYVVIVNTASKCGFTGQYEGLEQLYRKYKDKNVVVLGFPCNQFANQEPGDEASIKQGCILDYDVTFPMFSKVDVNGEDTHPLFKYLKSELAGLFGGVVKWNFTKFIVGPDGKPLKRYSPFNKPEEIDKYLSKLINSSVIERKLVNI